jgi:hypothetical protein
MIPIQGADKCMIKSISIVLTLPAILLSCAGSKEVVQETKPIVYDESFDPATLNDEDIIITAEERDTPAPKKNKQVKQKDEDTEVLGYRVQIIALTDPINASLVEQEARERFELNGYKTYSIFEAPFIKIRVGDCEDRKCAENLRELARDVFNYKEAQIIRTKIRLQPADE